MNYPRVRTGPIVFALAFLALALIDHPTVQGKDNWTSVHSQNFQLVGNASEKDIRLVANRLEQFRKVFALLFPSLKLNSPVPTTVIVFKSDSSYKPFKVNPNVAGYFQPGKDVNYITLTSEKLSDDQPYRTIFHEYVHLLVENTMGGTVPLWFNEGLAEYYSTFNITDENRRVILGEVVRNHVLYLREQKLLPLRTLFAVDYKSPYYNEGNKMNIFYAEAWMLMHYLLQGEGQKRRPQLARFVDLVRSNLTVDEAFQQAFQIGIDAFEKDFRSYVQGAKYMATAVTFEKKLDFDSQMQSAPVTEGEAEAYLGDLLLHTRRLNDAESHLQQALTLSPELPMAEASFGMLRVRQGRLADARQYLEKAVAGNSQNYLTHFYYAYALSGLTFEGSQIVNSYAPEDATTMRAELRKAIALKPDFPESYALLGFINVVRNEEVDETIGLLKRVVTMSRSNERVVFMLAQLYMRKQDFAEARRLLGPMTGNSPDPELRQHAQSLMEGITRSEALLAQDRALEKQLAPRLDNSSGQPPRSDGNSVALPDSVQPDWDVLLSQSLRKPHEGEMRVRGVLTAIECNAKGMTFKVRAGDRLLQFHSDNFERLAIIAFTNEVPREIVCGP
ncbi:MAG TPA: tetratricopeptide repeat protein, partial [Pyrinomonadaceae bacterium]|nr:tetratricopeptide repeat protein [Pyrinomonadaceae bacterium]